MSKQEQARNTANDNMNAQWAENIGDCGMCQKAADGECSMVSALARAAGISPDDAHYAISERIDAEAPASLRSLE